MKIHFKADLSGRSGRDWGRDMGLGSGAGIALFRYPFLKSEYQNDPAHQPGKGQELIAAYLQLAVDEQHLPQDQENGKSYQDDLFERGFCLAFDEAKNRDEGEEYPR